MQIRNIERTEWLHCSIDLLHEAFEKAKRNTAALLPYLKLKKWRNTRKTLLYWIYKSLRKTRS